MRNYLLFCFLLVVLGCKPESVIPETENGIPIMSITTNDATPIDTKLDYVKARVKISNQSETRIHSIQIRGRGNSTWDKFPKKPYQIKFDHKVSVLGMPPDEKWILLANYSDKTMIRNELAFQLSKMSNLDWTPESRYVNVILNDEYIGVYQVTQKVEGTSNRVALPEDGYLLEVDQMSRLDPDDVYFENNHYLFNIKEPRVEFDDHQFNLIKDFIEAFEDALFSESFTEPEVGYEKFIDIDSFIDWYLIHEIAKSNDGDFHSSVYLNYIPGEKLKMGPVWDFDISFGNINYNGNETTDGFWIKNGIWYTRLFEDPSFANRVKYRFNYFYNNQQLIFDFLESESLFLDQAQMNNFDRWPILGVYIWPNNVYPNSYSEELDYLKRWYSERMEWMNVSLQEM